MADGSNNTSAARQHRGSIFREPRTPRGMGATVIDDEESDEDVGIKIEERFEKARYQI
jgi:hypothetical protein